MGEVMHNLLVRMCDQKLNEVLGILVEDAVRRPVTFRVNRGGLDPGEATLDGLVLIGPDDGPRGVEDLRRRVGECSIKVLATPEVWWLPLNAYRDAPTGYWSIECVPLVEWTKVASRPDSEILNAVGIDPETGRPREEQP